MSWEPVSSSVLNEAQFFVWQKMLEERTGTYLSIKRKALLQSTLNVRMREIGCKNYDQYFQQVSAKPSGVIEWNILLDRLMVQETRFYRNPESLDLVKEYIAGRVKEHSRKMPINIWSVGCSTGEEAYTLAMLCLDAFQLEGVEPKFGITATDISLPALKKAREGKYNARKLLDLDQDFVIRYFEQGDGTYFRVRDGVKQKVCFAMANIIDMNKCPQRNLDVIYCQNVLIYFRKERVATILDSLVDRLADGGILILGQGEITDWRHSDIHRVANNKVLAFVRQNNNSTY